mgnify:CR=1 FL=1
MFGKSKNNQIRRGSSKEELLRAVLFLESRGAYGVTIQQFFKENGRFVALPNIYAGLKKLEADGFLKSSWTEPKEMRGGRKCHVFHITDDGRAALLSIDTPLETVKIPGLSPG